MQSQDFKLSRRKRDHRDKKWSYLIVNILQIWFELKNSTSSVFWLTWTWTPPEQPLTSWRFALKPDHGSPPGFRPWCGDHTWDAGLAPGAPGHPALFNTDSRPGVAAPAAPTFEGSYYSRAGQSLPLCLLFLASGLEDNGGEEEVKSFLY